MRRTGTWALVAVASTALGACNHRSTATSHPYYTPTPIYVSQPTPYVPVFQHGSLHDAESPRTGWLATSKWGATVQGVPLYLVVGTSFGDPAPDCHSACPTAFGSMYTEYFEGYTGPRPPRRCGHTDSAPRGAYTITGGHGSLVYLRRADGLHATFDMATCRFRVGLPRA